MALRLVVDTNLLFECKPLEDLPWAELHADPIVLVLAKPVLDEIDKHKNGAGRTKKRALKIFSSIRSMLKEKAVEIVVRESAPRVVMKLLPTTSPLEQFKGDLNYDKNDDRLVGITATLQSDGGLETRLFSDDTGVASTATALGIPFEFIEDHWKREQEDDADTKHITELQKELKVLRLQEPQIVLKDAMERIGGRVEVTHKYPAPLSPDEVTQLVDELGRKLINVIPKLALS